MQLCDRHYRFLHFFLFLVHKFDHFAVRSTSPLSRHGKALSVSNPEGRTCRENPSEIDCSVCQNVLHDYAVVVFELKNHKWRTSLAGSTYARSRGTWGTKPKTDLQKHWPICLLRPTLRGRFHCHYIKVSIARQNQQHALGNGFRFVSCQQLRLWCDDNGIKVANTQTNWSVSLSFWWQWLVIPPTAFCRTHIHVQRFQKKEKAKIKTIPTSSQVHLPTIQGIQSFFLSRIIPCTVGHAESKCNGSKHVFIPTA